MPLQGLLFQISSKGSFMYVHHPTDRIKHTTAFVTPVVKHWPEREIAQWVHLMKDRSDDPLHNELMLLPRSYISPLFRKCTYRTTQTAREETRCHHFMDYSFHLVARNVLYAPSHIQDSTYHSLCYTSRGALAGMRNSSMGPP